MTTLIAVDGAVQCDERCYNAVHKRCECVCGGENHGKGREQAMDNTREHGEEWLRAAGYDVADARIAMDAQCAPLFALTEGAPEMTDGEVWYRGDATSTAGPHAVIIETGGHEPLGMLVHVAKHSPTGMSWGYAGSGAADLARSLLIAVLGEDARCRLCNGTHKIVWDSVEATEPRAYDPTRDRHQRHVESCYDCDDGYRRLPYQDFKFQFVAGWGDSFRVSRSEILAWLAEHDEPTA